MAIKPKKQTPSNRGETGGGAPRGGSVRVLKPAPKAQRDLENSASKSRAEGAKSGLSAKLGAKGVMTGSPKSTVKINSAPKKSPDAARAANAKALKAANKGKKK